MAELSFKRDGRILFTQDGQEYDLNHLPEGFVIQGDVNLFNMGLTELPDLSKVVVMGNFRCSWNKLTSLEGAPKEVDEGFYCSSNQLTSLKGAPRKVKNFNCSDNQLTSLKGAPQEVENFYCSGNRLTSLKGAPGKAKDFDCSGNRLTSLKGAPQEVENFNCSDNRLTSLNGAPQEVENFYCSGNRLTSLKGAPEKFRRETCFESEEDRQAELALSHWLKPGDIDVTGYDINGFDISNGDILPSQEMYGEYNRLAAQKREEDARRKRLQKPNKKPLKSEDFQSIPGQYDLLKEALSKKKPDVVQELFKTGQVTGLTPEEGEALLGLIPKTERWEVVKRFIKSRIVKYPILRPAQETKAAGSSTPEDAPNPAEKPSGTGLKGCLEKAAQGASTETQDRPHAKVARSRPVFKRMNGKRGPRD